MVIACVYPPPPPSPLIVLPVPEKVCVPELALYVPLLVRLPAIPTTAFPFSVNVPPLLIVTSEPNVNASATDSVIIAPLLIVTAPVKVFVPVVEVMFKMPLVPFPTVVVPDTVNEKAPTLKVVPSPILKLPPIIVEIRVEIEALPVRLKLLNVVELLPPMVFVAPVMVTVPVAAVNVPLFVQLPPTLIVGELVFVRVPVEDIIRFPLILVVPPD